MPARSNTCSVGEDSASITMSGRPEGLRLLLPVNHEADSCWAWRYAVQKHERGSAVEACILHVAKQIDYCEVFRTFRRTATDPGTSEPAIPHLAEAIAVFDHAGIPVRAFLAAGGPVEAILDMAERLECDEIVLPLNDRPGWLGGFWHHNTVRFIQEREREIPVVTVDEKGQPLVGLYARRRPAGRVA